MAFFNSAIDILQTLVIAIGAGLGAWGVVNLLEGYGNDNPGAKSQGIGDMLTLTIETFLVSFYFMDPIPENMPTLGDLYECLKKQPEPEAKRIATALEIYVNGSLKVFKGACSCR